MKKSFSWIFLALISYGLIELISYGGLFLLNKYKNISYTPADVISAGHSRIIRSFIDQTGSYLSFSPTLGWNIKPNGSLGLYQANSSGFRSSKEYALTPPPGVLRVSTFGDSFTHGDDVKNEDTWQAKMEQFGLNLEVLNFGVGAFGLDQAYLRYLEDGPRYHPHIVLMGFMTENIFRIVNTYRPFYFTQTGTPLTKPRFIIREDNLVLIPNPMQSIQDYEKLLLHPKDVFSEMGIHDFYYRRRYTSSKFDWSPTVRLAKLTVHEVKNISPEEEIINRSRYRYNEQSEAFKVTKKIFDEFFHTSLENKSIPLIVLFPNRLDFVNYFALQLKLYSPLLEYFDTAGYHYIDLIDAFENSGYEKLNLKDLFAPAHYSPLANSIVAKFILRYLSNLHDQEIAPTVRFPQ